MLLEPLARCLCPSEECGEGEPEGVLCGEGEVFLPFPLQGHFPRSALPLLGVGRHRPEQAVGAAIRGEGQRQPRRQGEPVVGAGAGAGQLGFKLPPIAAGAGQPLQDDRLEQGVHPPCRNSPTA